ncbi:MAG: GNAT family N-acetyltransferase [gamma proteobacterium symbiont of Clathrolucina costata]
MAIREIKKSDLKQWSKMRTSLWPNTQDNHLSEINEYFSGESIDIDQVYVAVFDQQAVGFIELNLRNFAEGSRHPLVPYVEAWYVEPEHRGMGYGKALMRQAEEWALAQGCTELASDTEITNHQSIAMHRYLGFEETERIVCFLKKLNTID